MCDWHLVASLLESSDNGNGVMRDRPKWSVLFHKHFLSFCLRRGEQRGEERDCIQTHSTAIKRNEWDGLWLCLIIYIKIDIYLEEYKTTLSVKLLLNELKT